MTPINRYFRLLTLLTARLVTPFLPGLPARLGLKRSGRITISGIEQPLTISRDHVGIPTIRAQTSSDLFFAFGYAIAQDRLFQMDLHRRLAGGQLAEIVGDRPIPVKPGSRLEAPSVVLLDCLHRALGLVRVAQASWEIISDEARTALEQYTAGVNAAMVTMQDEKSFPPEFYMLAYEPKPWTPYDSLAIGRLIAWMLCLAARAELVLSPLASHQELSPLLPVYPVGEPIIVQDGGLLGGIGGGSNSWVVGPGRTRSGHPLLCNDPHMPMGLPPLFYQVALQGGEYDAIGATMPGVPAVVVGANGDIAWGMTSAMPDDADVYRETIHPSDPNLYAFQGEWRRVKVGTEEIRVRNSPPRRVTIRYIPRGKADCPLLNDILQLDTPLCLRWTGLEPSREIDALLNISRARGLDEFQSGLRDFAVPAQNFVCADRRGNYAYFCAGRFPRRKKGEGTFPMDGASGGSEWEGDIPYDELPSQINPPSGVIVTANHRIMDDAYPHELTYLWEPPYRARRILELLDRGGLDITDMAAIQGDILSVQARAVVTQVIAPVVGELYGRARRLAERLIRWDFRMGTESGDAALYHVIYERLRFLVFADRLNAVAPELYRGYFSLFHLAVNPVDQILTEGSEAWMPEGRVAVVQRALEEAGGFLESALGGEEGWSWGRLHRFTLRHPLSGGQGGTGAFFERIFQFNRGPFPHPGDGMTVNAAAYLLSHPFDGVVGPVYRQIVDLGNPPASLWVVPGGSSGDPFSPHYSDQLMDWRHLRYHPMMPNSGDTSSVLELTPTGWERF